VKAAVPAVHAPFDWRNDDGVDWIEATLPNAVAGFTTRCGGVSRGRYAELNLGILTDDDQAKVARNREIVAETLERDPQGFAMGFQVHGSELQVHHENPSVSAFVSRTDLVEADAQLTSSPGVTTLVLVADCVPLVLSAPGAVGAVHCGWRGIAAGIVPKAVNALCDLAGANPSVVSAAIGPAIGACCYEVGEDVIAVFRERELDQAVKGDRLDIVKAIRVELERSGVESVADVAICTSCNPDLFFSHRRDGPTGRQAGIAWLT
jgi:YfiH family protein